jgi:hypothetical protein
MSWVVKITASMTAARPGRRNRRRAVSSASSRTTGGVAVVVDEGDNRGIVRPI